MKARYVSPALAGLAFAIATLFAVAPAFADKVELDYSCSCKKKPKVKEDVCKASSSPTVTIKTTANGKDSAREDAASNQCFLAFGKSCPRVSCDAPVTKVGGPRAVDVKASSPKASDANKAGMTNKQVEGLVAFAQDNGYTIVFRETNDASRKYQDEEGYRPKPLDVSALKTAKKGKYAGLITLPDKNKLKTMSDEDKKKVDAEVERLKKAGWTFDKELLRDPQGRAIHGDYDLQGLYKGKKLLDTNKPKGDALRKELNEAIDPERTDEEMWLVQHGGQDNYRKADSSIGRYPDPDETFLIVEPDGNTLYIESVEDLEKYYDDHEMKWHYRKREK